MINNLSYVHGTIALIVAKVLLGARCDHSKGLWHVRVGLPKSSCETLGQHLQDVRGWSLDVDASVLLVFLLGNILEWFVT